MCSASSARWPAPGSAWAARWAAIRASSVTIDLDATQVTVFGQRKQGAGRSRHGSTGYAPHVAFWAQRGRALTCELVGADREKLSGRACATLAARSIGLLPAGHGPLTMRVDSAYYALELLERLRQQRSRLTVSVPRTQAMCKALGEIPEDAWTDALEMPGAQVTETTYTPAGWRHEPLRLIVRRVAFSAHRMADGSTTARRRNTIHPDQLALALDGQLASVFGYSFILTDIPHQPTVWIEHFHRHRAQIQEPIKDTKLGQALRHPPSGDHNANRVWLTAALLALNLSAFCCDLCPAAGASGKAPDDAPLRRAAHTLRRILFQHPRPHHPQRPAHDPAPAPRLPPRRRLRRDPRHRLRAAATPTPARARRRRPPAPPTSATPQNGRSTTTPTQHRTAPPFTDPQKRPIPTPTARSARQTPRHALTH